MLMLAANQANSRVELNLFYDHEVAKNAAQ